MINAEHDGIKTIVSQCALGELLAPPCALQGGELHKMYYVQTTKGVFAVKALNPYFYTRKDFPEHYEQTECLAYAFSQKGVPAVYALSFDGKRVIYEHGYAYLIYPYLSGNMLDTPDLSVIHIQRLGTIISNLHQAGVALASSRAPQFDYSEDAHWQVLIEETQDSALLQLLPAFLRWNAYYRQAQEVLVQEWVMSHCDLHGKNVIWDKQEHASILDWENAGSVNPYMEVLGFALEWSGIVEQCRVDKPVFFGIFTRYFERHSQVLFHAQAEAAFYGWLGHLSMGWTEFNIRRAFGKVACSEAERHRAMTLLTQQAIPFFNYIQAHERDILQLIQQLSGASV